MAFNRFYVISPLALIAVSACRSPYVAESAVSGAVVKGPLSNALVFLDYNDDGELDRDNEPFAQTDSFGEYELTATQDTYTLIAMATDQTVDTSSGAALSGITLKAPSGATVITPTTTLMEEGDISAEEVAAVLGLPDGVDPLSFNPFNVDENDAAAVAAALEVEKVSQQIMTAVTSFASAAEGAGAGAGDAFTAALGSVVDVVKAKAEKIDDPTAAAGDAELDFTDAADLALIKTEATSKAAALDGIDAATMNALADDTTDAIQNVNEKIATVTDLDDQATKNIFSTMQVLQDQVKDAAETQKAGGTGNISFKDSDAVDTAALNSAPSAITLSGDRLVSADGELVVGTVETIDPDTDDTTFTYTLAGDDAKFFDFDASSGELSLKEAPDFNVKPYYEITIITKDPGGKPYAETFIIDVVPEFGSLVDPDPTVASDFNTIVLQNPLFMQMSSAVELKQTSDGQLVLVELMSSEDDEYSSPSDSEGDGPINAFINVSDRGYELRNPANNEYMGGFFTYEQDGLTYTGYEVLVDDMSVLAEYDTDLTKYFDPESTYGTGQLTYTARDIEAVALAGVKVVDKDGVTVQDMLGFNHYGKDMNPLGSAGVDVADPSVPYYIEVVGEYDPAVTTNITATDITVLHDASVGLEMQTLLQSAAEAVLYGDDHDHDEEEGDDAVNGGDIITDSAPSAITLSGDRLVSADGPEEILVNTLVFEEGYEDLVVGTIDTTDPNEGDTFTYTITGEDADFFNFDESIGELSLKADPDSSVKAYYNITITTEDEGGETFAQDFVFDLPSDDLLFLRDEEGGLLEDQLILKSRYVDATEEGLRITADEAADDADDAEDVADDLAAAAKLAASNAADAADAAEAAEALAALETEEADQAQVAADQAMDDVITKQMEVEMYQMDIDMYQMEYDDAQMYYDMAQMEYDMMMYDPMMEMELMDPVMFAEEDLMIAEFDLMNAEDDLMNAESDLVDAEENAQILDQVADVEETEAEQAQDEADQAQELAQTLADASDEADAAYQEAQNVFLAAETLADAAEAEADAYLEAYYEANEGLLMRSIQIEPPELA